MIYRVSFVYYLASWKNVQWLILWKDVILEIDDGIFDEWILSTQDDDVKWDAFLRNLNIYFNQYDE